MTCVLHLTDNSFLFAIIKFAACAAWQEDPGCMIGFEIETHDGIALQGKKIYHELFCYV